MDVAHHYALLAGYGTALAGWLVCARLLPALWPRGAIISFAHPWREIGWALLAGLGVIAIGQLYVRGWLLPKTAVATPLLEALNQLLIFAPMLALPFLRRQPLATAWVPTHRIWARVLIGSALAALAILVFTQVVNGSDTFLHVFPRVYQPKNIGFLVQVWCEDFALAVVFVRLRAALGLPLTTVLVACLFAAGHVPTMIATGATAGELSRLLLDAALGVAVLIVVQRSADIWWFWCVHFALDMMQFYAAAPAAG